GGELDGGGRRGGVGDAGRGIELPGAHREPEVLRGQGPHRADVDGVQRVRVVQHLAGRDGENLAVAAVGHLELVLPGDLVADADAARAQDAALLIEDDVGPRSTRLGLTTLARMLRDGLPSHSKYIFSTLPP